MTPSPLNPAERIKADHALMKQKILRAIEEFETSTGLKVTSIHSYSAPEFEVCLRTNLDEMGF